MPYCKSKPKEATLTYTQMIQGIHNCNHQLRSNPEPSQRMALTIAREHFNQQIQSHVIGKAIADIIF